MDGDSLLHEFFRGATAVSARANFVGA